jgi:predicted dehydrogenase
VGVSDLRGVAVGTGYFSQFHFDAWQRIPHAKIVAVCSRDPVQAQVIAERFAIAKVYPDVEAMLDAERPDFIDIITPPDSHAVLVCQASERGVHILCQKALAPSYAEARAIVAGAAQTGVRLMVHDNFRFQPWHREIKRLLQGGAIGSLQSIVCCTRLGDGWGDDAYLSRQPYFRDMPRFLVFETGVHFIDVYRFLGGEIARVYARLRRLNPAIAGEDRGQVLFDFASGAEGLWDADRYHEAEVADPRYTFGEFLLEGSAGSLRLDGSGAIHLHLLGASACLHEYVHSNRGFAGDCVFATINHFVARLLDGAPFETSGINYLRTLAVQEAVYESAARGEPVRVPSVD